MPPKRRLRKSMPESEESEQELSLPDSLSQQIVSKKRNIRKNTQTKSKTKSSKQQSKSNDIEDEVIDIKRGDNFINQHIRPQFLKRWNQESNQLELEEDQIAAMSPLFQIYWKEKAKNMNCVILVQIGKMEFFAFENDAILLHQMFKKPLKKYSKFLMVNFWYKEVQLAKLELFERNIPVMMLNEVDDPKYRQINKLVKRQITQVLTPALFLTMQPKTHKQRLLLSIYRSGNKFGVVALQSQSNRFFIQDGIQADGIHQIRRIINRYRPVEILLSKSQDTKQIKYIAKNICQPFVVENSYMQESILDTISSFKQLNNCSFFKQILLLYTKENKLHEQQFSLYLPIRALALILSYLEKLGLQTKIFGQGLFEMQCFEKSKMRPMFDAQVYENLEIFRIKNQDQGYSIPGTLLHYLDKCNTNSGKKLLKRWLDEPLRIKSSILQRQLAIKSLVEKHEDALSLHSKLIGFQKLEKNITDIYHWVVKNSEKGKLIYTNNLSFQKDYNQKKNPAVVKLKEIHKALKSLSKLQEFLFQFSEIGFDSKLLKKIVNVIPFDYKTLLQTPVEEAQKLQGIPSIFDLTKVLMRKINYNEQSDYVQPEEGVNEIFDMEKQIVREINSKLNDELQRWKKEFNCNKITYTSARARNQITIPKSVIKGKKFSDLIYSSETSTVQRYVTVTTSQLSEQLIEHQQQLAKAYQPFMNSMIIQFCKHKYIWDIYLKSLSQLDVLLSLARVAVGMAPKCLPQFEQSGIYIKDGVHVGLLQVSDKVVPNTLKMEGQQIALLLTGPNMGGKSTLLRQTCLLAIMAQIGSYVPAKQYRSIIFDQIFCRIGASDRILQGKSTFYVQLQQTQRVLSQATPESLVIIDQLGRGTSTYDGMAIAESTLQFLIEQIGCYTLFSTHYAQITTSFLDNSAVKCMRIGYIFEGDQIKFTYQLQNGISQRSFANNVAKIVKMPKQILQKAKQKANQIIQKQELMNNIHFATIVKQLGIEKLVYKNDV